MSTEHKRCDDRELVRQLRQNCAIYFIGEMEQHTALFRKAADAIERLLAENKRLKAEAADAKK
jgi:pyrroloquinoline quinone (PQQ) biosynthesis protein C